MKKPVSPVFKVLQLLALFAGWLWLCWAFPDAITRAIESLGNLLVLLVATALVVCPILAFLAAVFTSSPPPAPPPPVRQRDTLTPLLLGLALGWWLGGGPGDGDC